jgi:hypothetical protein
MKRRNVQLAFEGEGSSGPSEDVGALIDGDEAVDVSVLGGKLMVVVPARTPDDGIFAQARRLGGELLLENGQRLSFEIEGEAVGALFSTTPIGEQRDTHPGLSSLGQVPGGT